MISRWNDAILQRMKSRELDLLEVFARTAEAERIRSEFFGYGADYAVALKFPRRPERPDREGDLLVLKRPNVREKGVILLKYNDAFLRFAALFRVREVAEHYRIVLEPSSWGYEDPAILSYLGLPTDVLVEAQYAPDFEVVANAGGNFVPLPIGAGDWVNPDLFTPGSRSGRIYDVAMVASWQPLKRHHLLFGALRRRGGTIRRVALVGYPTGGYTVDRVKRLARSYGVIDKLSLFDSVPPAKVSEILQQSRLSVMLSRREGASRALYESVFCGTPIIVSSCNIGVNRALVNEATGCFASDDELGDCIASVLNREHSFHPREWALANTGYPVSTRNLEEVLRGLADRQGEVWRTSIFRKCNTPNAMFVSDEERALARGGLTELQRFLRASRTKAATSWMEDSGSTAGG